MNENLLDVLEQLIGPEISSNPVQHVRIKPPEKYLPKTDAGQPLIGATLWHQDHGVVVPEADETNMVTVWFSLTDTPVESGPLNVVPGTHRGDLLTHCDNYAHNTTMVQGRQIPREAVPLPGCDTVADGTWRRDLSCTSGRCMVLWVISAKTCAGRSTSGTNNTGAHSGRVAFPEFVARSRSNPDSELRDPVKWHDMWMDCRKQMSKINQGGQFDIPFGRWEDGHPDCEN